MGYTSFATFPYENFLSTTPVRVKASLKCGHSSKTQLLFKSFDITLLQFSGYGTHGQGSNHTAAWAHDEVQNSISRLHRDVCKYPKFKKKSEEIEISKKTTPSV